MKGFFLIISFGAQRLCTNVSSTLLYDSYEGRKKNTLCFIIGLLLPNSGESWKNHEI